MRYSKEKSRYKEKSWKSSNRRGKKKEHCELAPVSIPRYPSFFILSTPFNSFKRRQLFHVVLFRLSLD